ncbi:hypothetical protein [Epilithonimonas tenax]|uniref:hypothetical protein n=1 Tax=Epilithonimonas tenax TaxID=191577 RepID=UPI001E35BC42|nr:hypothetical protein [Epilithonimonas tenax]
MIKKIKSLKNLSFHLPQIQLNQNLKYCLTQTKTIMNYLELLHSGANVSITVNLKDLHDLLKEVSGTSNIEIKTEESEEFLSRKNTLTLLNIDSSTLWNWEKTGYIISHPFGGRKRYKKSDIELIQTGKKGK